MQQQGEGEEEVIITLPSPGCLPGIGGGPLAPGVYLVDWGARTVRLATPAAADLAEAEADGTRPSAAEIESGASGNESG